MASPIYSVKASEFLDTTNFGIGALVADFENQKNLGYGHYVNDVGEAFFTLDQSDPKAALLRDLADRGGHIQIYRNADNVWSGWLGETDEQPNDVVFYAYSYEAGLFERQSDWEQTFSNSQIDSIFTTLWARAQSNQSRMGWMTTGTLEAPVTDSNGSIAYILASYVIYFKRILFAMKELVAAAISDTTNRVVFEITPAGQFNLWKNRGTDLTDIVWQWGSPDIMGYRRQRKPLEHRNVINAVGSTPQDATLRSTYTNADDITDMGGRREESIYLNWVKDQGELDRVSRNRLAIASRLDSFLAMTFAPGVLTPFRATGQSYKLTDGVRVIIDNGSTQINEIKLIVGQQVVHVKNQEYVRPLLGDVPVAFEEWLRLAHGQSYNDSVTSSHALPVLTIAGDKVLLVAFVQDRDASVLTFPAGWTQRTSQTVSFGDNLTKYSLWDRYVATAASPYAETFTSATASRSHQAEMAFRAFGATVPAETVSDSEVYYPGFSPQPTLTVTLTAATTQPGDLLIGYTAVAVSNGSTGGGYVWPDGWLPLELLYSGTANGLGYADTYYKIADGTEGAIAVQNLGTEVESMVLIVVNYGQLDI